MAPCRVKAVEFGAVIVGLVVATRKMEEIARQKYVLRHEGGSTGLSAVSALVNELTINATIPLRTFCHAF
jgi:hypothetical protein